uniref:Uncharacterized protein n=1 Tax=Micrurus carvalhoi TaxID=3147026 RepID=A0A2H6MWZ9_9SAUR
MFEDAISTNWTRHTYFPRIHNFVCEGFFTHPFSHISFKSDLGITDSFSKSNTCFLLRSKGLFPQRHPSRCGRDFPLQLGKKKKRGGGPESSQLTAKMEFKPCRPKPMVCQDNVIVLRGEKREGSLQDHSFALEGMRSD